MSQNKKKEVTNFIPLCKLVYLLNEEDSKISHDIPFVNSYSGTIDIKISALSPLFIRNHYVDGDDYYEIEKENKTIKVSKEFCHFNKKFYIPASSIKGMIRNMVEIFSYSKLATISDDNKELFAKLNQKKENLYQKHFENSLDLSEAIFGTKSLKGRVYFSHFIAQKNIKSLDEVSTILMSPSPKRNKIGWKRYPNIAELSLTLKNKNKNIVTHFKPLPAGSEFIGKLRFHNLRDYEFGALLSALSFHNTEDAFHTIGLAKPQGYGKIKLTFDYPRMEKLLSAFEKKMSEHLRFKNIFWHKSRYIEEIFKRHSLKQFPKTCLSKQETNAILHFWKLKDKIEQDVKVGSSAKILQNKRSNAKPQATLNDLAEKFGGIKKQPKKRKEGSGKPKNPFGDTIKKVPKESLPVETPAKKEQTTVPKTAPAALPKEYTMKEIAQETGLSVADVVAYANASTLSMPKGLDNDSVLKEAQAKGLINRLKKEKKQ